MMIQIEFRNSKKLTLDRVEDLKWDDRLLQVIREMEIRLYPLVLIEEIIFKEV